MACQAAAWILRFVLKIPMHVISDRAEYFDLLTRFLSTYGEFM